MLSSWFALPAIARSCFCRILAIAVLTVPIANALEVPYVWKYAEQLESPMVLFDAPVPACAWGIRNFPKTCSNSGSILYSKPNWIPCTVCGGGSQCSYQLDYYRRGCGSAPDTYPDQIQYNWVIPIRTCPPLWNLTRTGATNYSCRGPDDLTPPNFCPLAGNPVQVSKGWKYWTETDVAKPFEFRRYYTSRPSNGFLQTGFGQQWSHSYARRLLVTNDPKQVWVVRAEGSLILFRQDAAGQWNGTPATGLRLTTQASGFLVWSEQDEQEAYDTAGRLQSLVTREGRQFTLQYNPTTDLLLRIQDDQGRSLTFAPTEEGTRFASMTDPTGVVLHFQYSDSRELSSINWVDSDGTQRQRTYTYEHAGNSTLLTGIISETGQRYSTYTYDNAGRVQSTTHWSDATHPVDTFTFSYPTPTTTQVTTPLGAALTYTSAVIAGIQRLTDSTQPCASCGGSDVQSRTYDAQGYPLTTTDFNGHTTRYTYDGIRGLETERVEAANDPATPSAQRTTRTQWHPSFRVPVLRQVYDAGNGLRSQVSFAYNGRGQTTARCEVDVTNAQALGTACSLTGAVPAGVRRTTSTYCEAVNSAPADAVGPGENLQKGCPLVGLLRRVDGARTDVADVTTYTYRLADDAGCANGGSCAYRAGDRWQTINALGQISEVVSYDGAGRVTRRRDSNGTLTDLTYSPRGWLLRRTLRANESGSASPQDATTTFAYDAVGNITRITQPDGSVLSYSYDAAHRLTDISDGSSNRIHYTLDAAGNRIKEDTYAPNGAVTRTLARRYTALNQLAQQIDALNHTTTFSYDANGNRIRSVDALTTQTDQHYDALNRLIHTIEDATAPNGTPTKNTTTAYTYDALDQLTGITDPDSVTTQYTFDGVNNSTQLHSPDSGDTTYTYDAAGNRLTQTDARGITTAYTYDALNRLTTITYPDPTLTTTYQYDRIEPECAPEERYALGRLTGMSDESGRTTYCYDRHGNPTRKTQKRNNYTFILSYTYTAADRLASITYPSGAILSYTRDAQGQIARIATQLPAAKTAVPIERAQYLPFGPLNQLVYSNGRHLDLTYDANYAVTRISDPAPGGLNLYYTHDALGNLHSASVTPNTPDRLYHYDALSRLIQVDNATNTALETYTYNPTGDRLSHTTPTEKQVYRYSTPLTQHHLQAINSSDRSYDNSGNLLSQRDASTRREYTYTAANRLQSYRYNGTLTLINSYNGHGERLIKTQPGSPDRHRYFIHDENGLLLGEYDDTGTAIQEYLYLEDRLVGIAQKGTLYPVETDHLGSPRRVIDSQRTIAIWSWDYLGNAFGVTPPNEDPDQDGKSFTLNLRFPGQYFDQETGLYHNGFRDYEPQTGRYTQSDPIGLQGGVNTYSYVGNNPLKWVDRFGLLQDGSLTDLCYGQPSWTCNEIRLPPPSVSLDNFFFYGYWCGPGWTGGGIGTWGDIKDKGNWRAPIDQLDGCCMTHDICYSRCRNTEKCDSEGQADCFQKCDRDLTGCANIASTIAWGHKQALMQYMARSKPEAEHCGCGH